MKTKLVLLLGAGILSFRIVASEPQWIIAADAREATEEEKKNEQAPEGTSRFFRTVKNAKKVTKATCTATSLGVFEFYVNGRRAGEQVLMPGFTHGLKTKYSFDFDITNLISKEAGSENVFSARVSTGWWNDRVAGYIGRKSAFWGRIVLQYDDGSREEIVTDAKWLADTADPVVRAGIFDGEIYDARKANAGMPSAPALVSNEFKGEILACNRAGVVMREDLAFEPQVAYVWKGIEGASKDAFGTVKKVRDGFAALDAGETLIVDFGQNAAAVPEFVARSQPGVKLTILPAEMLNDGNGLKSRGCDGPEGMVYRVNLRHIHKTGARVEYTFGSSETETYRPAFTFFGYRYAALIATGKVQFSRLRSIPVTSITASMERGKIETGNKSINQLISNVKWGMYSNYLSVPTDCPQRDERQGWTADTQVFAEAGSFLADTYGFFRKFMRDMRDTQTECGSYTGVAPVGCYGDADDKRLGWSDCGIIVPYVMWRQTGRTEMLAEHWDSMVAFMDFLKVNRYAAGTALKYQWADWLSYEDFESAGGKSWKDGKLLPEASVYWKYLGAAYWLMDARMMSGMAAALGKADAAEEYRRMAVGALEYIRGEILENGQIPACLRHMQTPALFALYCDLLPREEDVAATKAALLKNIREHGDCLQTGFLGTSILMDTLTKIGASDVAYTLLLQRKNPSWLYSVDQGATTIWERWNSYRKDTGFGPVGMNSFNHYAYGSVLAWMFKTAAGIQCGNEAGYKSFSLAPVPDERLGRISAVYPTQYGQIKSSWEYVGGKLNWHYTIPAGTSAEVHHLDGSVSVVSAGSYHEEK